MARSYCAEGARNCSTASTCLGITSTAAIRPSIFYISVGSLGAPGSYQIQWKFQRHTAPGTSTAMTPAALDSGNPAAVTIVGYNHTGEPTITASTKVLELQCAQQTGDKWYGQPGREIILPATAANGVGALPIHASYTGSVSAVMHFDE